MALNRNNLIVGAARLWLGPAGTTKPAPVAGTRYRTTVEAAGGWTEVGYTQDGLEVATDPTYTEIEVDQQMDTPKMFKSGMSMSVSTTLVEATLDNLLMAWGQQANTLSSLAAGERELTMEGGALGDAPVERGLIAVANGPDSDGVAGERVYHWYRVMSVEASTHTLNKTDPVGIPVTFRAFPDDTTGRYGTTRDRTGPFTS